MSVALIRAVLLRRACWRALDLGNDQALRQLAIAASIAEAQLRPIDWYCYSAWLHDHEAVRASLGALGRPTS